MNHPFPFFFFLTELPLSGIIKKRAAWEEAMDFLRFLEGIRTPIGDVLMSVVTHLGEETLFMILALTIFWCVDKKRGYFLLFAGFTGTVCVQFLKMLFRIPRPWVLDPDFSIVESARAEATGYSFPSGHTQIATTFYGGLARSAKTRAFSIVCIVIWLLVAFSRMYLGVHTPLDVLVSMAIGLAIVLLYYPLMNKASRDPRLMYALIGAMLLLTLGNLLFVELFRFPADLDLTIFANARKVAWQLLFIILGLCVIYPMDRHVIKFQTDAVWWAQVLKLAGGTTLIILCRALLKAPLHTLFAGHPISDGIRYFIIVVAAGVLWPLTFRYFAKLGKQKKEKTA